MSKCMKDQGKEEEEEEEEEEGGRKEGGGRGRSYSKP